jgi:hypothetical protein
VSKHCLSTTNLFIDILYPFVTNDFDINLSSMDFTELIIRSNTFDDTIPISNAITKNNMHIPRYKINVDPDEYPNEAFINDIYYGAYVDNTGEYTILTNSIPFELNTNEHVISYNTDNYTIVQKNSEKLDFVIKYTSPQGTVVSVILKEGDRVFVKHENIFDPELEKFLLDNLNIANKNLFHGFVYKDEASKLYIRLADIRKPYTIESPNSCFDEKWKVTDLTEESDVTIKKESCEHKENHTWDTMCRYNYECPYFKSNLNYKNFSGGCLSSGFCEMPLGIHKFSYTKYEESNDNKPMCNNCNSTDDNDCCTVENSNLKSPDYMFPHDTIARINEIQTLKDKSCTIMVNKYI